jgi:hypothetical protein
MHKIKTYSLDETKIKQIQDYAKKTGLKQATILDQALNEYFKKKDKKDGK